MIRCVVAHGGGKKNILKQQQKKFLAINEVLSKALTKHTFFCVVLEHHLES
jgi:hypothetical protein